MKKGQIIEGVIERVDFPNKGKVFLPEEDRYVIVHNREARTITDRPRLLALFSFQFLISRHFPPQLEVREFPE